MVFKYVSPLLDPNAAFDNALVGNNPLSFSMADYMNGPSALTSGGGVASAALGGYSPSSFVGDLSGMSLSAPMSLWDQMKTKDFWTGSFNPTTGERTMGMGGLALGAGSALLNGWLGMKQYGLQKAQFDFQKDAFAKNWGVQRDLTNAQLEGQFAARAASREGASSNPYGTVQENMQKYKVA